MTIGIYASIAGAIGIIGGVYAESLAIMIIGQAVVCYTALTVLLALISLIAQTRINAAPGAEDTTPRMVK